MKLTNSGMSRLYKLYTFLAYVLPMVVLFIVNHDAYGKEEGIFGFWGIIVLMLCVIAFKNFVTEFFKKYRVLTVSVMLLIIGIFAEFLGSQLILIGVVSTCAAIVSLVFSHVGDVYDEHCYKMVNGEKVINKAPAIPQKEAWNEAYGYTLVVVEKNDEENNEQ